MKALLEQHMRPGRNLRAGMWQFLDPDLASANNAVYHIRQPTIWPPTRSETFVLHSLKWVTHPWWLTRRMQLAHSYPMHNALHSPRIYCRLVILYYLCTSIGLTTAVIVLQGATVLDLMRAVEKEISRRCFRVGRTSHLSWCVWFSSINIYMCNHTNSLYCSFFS